MTILMVLAMKIERNRFCLTGIHLSLSQPTCFQHLVKYDIPTPTGLLGTTNRVKERRILTHTHQSCTFVDGQVARFFVKISLGCSFDTHSIVKEIEIIEVHGDDFLLRIVALQFHGNYPLNGFLHSTLINIICLGAIELFSQLLGDSTSTASLLLAHDHALDHGT